MYGVYCVAWYLLCWCLYVSYPLFPPLFQTMKKKILLTCIQKKEDATSCLVINYTKPSTGEVASKKERVESAYVTKLVTIHMYALQVYKSCG